MTNARLPDHRAARCTPKGTGSWSLPSIGITAVVVFLSACATGPAGPEQVLVQAGDMLVTASPAGCAASMTVVVKAQRIEQVSRPLVSNSPAAEAMKQGMHKLTDSCEAVDEIQWVWLLAGTRHVWGSASRGARPNVKGWSGQVESAAGGPYAVVGQLAFPWMSVAYKAPTAKLDDAHVLWARAFCRRAAEYRIARGPNLVSCWESDNGLSLKIQGMSTDGKNPWNFELRGGPGGVYHGTWRSLYPVGWTFVDGPVEFRFNAEDSGLVTFFSPHRIRLAVNPFLRRVP